MTGSAICSRIRRTLPGYRIAGSPVRASMRYTTQPMCFKRSNTDGVTNSLNHYNNKIHLSEYFSLFKILYYVCLGHTQYAIIIRHSLRVRCIHNMQKELIMIMIGRCTYIHYLANFSSRMLVSSLNYYNLTFTVFVYTHVLIYVKK